MRPVITLPVGAAESYPVSVTDRNGAKVNLAGWTVTVKVGSYAASGVATSDPYSVEIPIEGTATAAPSTGVVGYIEATHPSGKPKDGAQFTLKVYAH